MPHGATPGTAYRRSKYASRVSTARKSKVSKARGAVKRIQRKAPRVTQVTKNRQSVVALSKSLYKIERKLLGARQENRSYWSYDNTNPHVSGEVFDDDRPFAICCEWFATANTPYMVGDLNANTFTARALPPFETADDIFTSLNNPYDMWKNAYDDIVSNEIYLPLYLKFQIEFEMTMKPQDQDVWLRLDVVKPTKTMRKGAAPHQYNITLPDGIPAFGKLATREMTQRNAINPSFYRKVQKTRWVRMINGHSGQNINSVIRRRVNVAMKFPNKPLKPDIEAGQSFLMNMPPEDLTWLIISTDMPANLPMKVKVMRHTVWRDQHGTTM